MTEKETPSFLGHRQRIKNKFDSSGLDAFADHEVLELLLTYSIPRKDTKPLAWALIKKFGSLSAVFDAPEEEICKTPGIGKSTALFLKLVRSSFKRYSIDNLKYSASVNSPQDVAAYCRASLEGKQEEVFEVIYLTVRNSIIGCEILAIGTLDRASITPRRVIESALSAKAANIILTHNHPSGDPRPSAEDLTFTEEVTRAAGVLGISVLDHIIVGKGGYYSMRAKGVI